MLFFKNKKQFADQGEVAAVLDFGSSSVKILICRFPGEQVEVLSGSKIMYSKTGGNREAAGLDPVALKKSLAEELKRLGAGLEKPLSLAVIGLGGLGAEGYTSQINYRRAHSENLIDEKEFSSILQKVELRAGEIMTRMIAWETAGEREEMQINSEVLDLTLDGYTVASPVGLKGEHLSFVIYNSYSREEILNTLLSITKELGLKVVMANSDVYTTMRAVMESLNAPSSVLVLDVGASATEIGLVHNERILGHIGLDVGGQSFTDSIALELGHDKDEAEVLKLGFSGGKLDDSLMKDIRELAATDCKVFSSGVELVMKEFPGFAGVPRKIFVVGGGALLPDIISCLQSATWGEEGTASNPPRVKLLTPQDLKGVKDLTGRLNSPADVPVLSLALDVRDFINDFRKKENILDKFIPGKFN